ncbi:hypothetical protein [Duganella sp. HH105]|uniref:hypothetical protein n=1 Tax=Duganella sp. HH105 TaxID=1781067 RepID=UPI000893337A|nr:hypothetical protein [Duganella sp. HH105]OEZ54881.1 hypothetical protein DUGA6_56520 [Duganella sp. HH105]
MPDCSRPNRINIDLGPYKQRWVAYCALHQLTPSAAFRQVVAKLTENMAPAGDAAAAPPAARKHRKEIGLTDAELRFIEACAEAEGFSPTRWIIALIQARMGNGAQFGQYELAALGKSNLMLLTIARQLRQIAGMPQGLAGGPMPELLPVVAEVRIRIANHTAEVAQAIARNMERWHGK